MRNRQIWPAALLALAIFVILASGGAQDKSGLAFGEDGKVANIQLSLFPPIQLYDTQTSIEGGRLGIFSMNADMTGIDLGLLTWTRRDLTALQLGIVNVVERKAIGVQFGTVNIVGEKTVGWQSGFLNIVGGGFLGFQDGMVNLVTSKETIGLQLSAVNYAESFAGLQLGLVNITEKLSGIQLGIANYAANSKVPILPIINAAF